MLDTPVEDMVFTVKDNIAVVPLRWLPNGRAFCRIETHFPGGEHEAVWRAILPKDIKDAPESLTTRLGECPTRIRMDDEEDLGGGLLNIF